MDPNVRDSSEHFRRDISLTSNEEIIALLIAGTQRQDTAILNICLYRYHAFLLHRRRFVEKSNDTTAAINKLRFFRKALRRDGVIFLFGDFPKFVRLRIIGNPDLRGIDLSIGEDHTILSSNQDLFNDLLFHFCPPQTFLS